MCCHIVRLNRIPFLIAEIGIVLSFKHCLGEGAIGLIHFNEIATLYSRDTNSGVLEYAPQCFGWWAKNKAEQLTVLPLPHCFLLDFIKLLQPMLAVLRGVLQQKKRNRRHGSGDIANVPFAALPDRSEVWRVLARIIIFAGTQ